MLLFWLVVIGSPVLSRSPALLALSTGFLMFIHDLILTLKLPTETGHLITDCSTELLGLCMSDFIQSFYRMIFFSNVKLWMMFESMCFISAKVYSSNLDSPYSNKIPDAVRSVVINFFESISSAGILYCHIQFCQKTRQ